VGLGVVGDALTPGGGVSCDGRFIGWGEDDVGQGAVAV
jgi:hypothetical protein